MKILIAPDSFKDCLSARKVAEYLKTGLEKSAPDLKIKLLPMADGGEGTVEAIIDATEGEFRTVIVHNPLMRKIEAKYGLTDNCRTAVIEIASASGLVLIKEHERNPWLTTSFGTGELILDALNNNCQRIIIGIGGSATNDAGVGMAMALGVKFLDVSGNNIGFGGGALKNISEIDISGLDKRLRDKEILIACDVTNPLTGPHGASYIYGPQKGADKEMVIKLDENLKHFASLIHNKLGKDIENTPGAGAAGGMGAGFLAFLVAKLCSGFELVKNETNLERFCAWADVIITGEGKIDAQTKYGKTPQGVAKISKKFDKKVIAVAGTLGDNYEELYKEGFDVILGIIDKPTTLENALKNAPQMLIKTGFSIGRILRMGLK